VAGGLPVAVGGLLWAPVGTALLAVDPRNGHVVKRVPLHNEALDLGGTWVVKRQIVVQTGTGDVVVDPRTARVVARWRGVGAPDGRFVWSVSPDLQKLEKRVALSGKLVATVDIGPARPDNWRPALAFGGGAIWIGRGQTDDVVRVDPATLHTQVFRGFDKVNSLLTVAYGYGHLWVQQNADRAGRLFMVDPQTGHVLAKTWLGNPRSASDIGGADMVLASGDVWTGDSSATMSQVDAHDGRLLHVYLMPSVPSSVQMAFGSAWLSGALDDTSPGLTQVLLPAT
jgi:hypothetical protein